MKTGSFRLFIAAAAAAVLALLTSFAPAPIVSADQAPAAPAARTQAPRAQTYSPPRTREGQPDLQGVWRVWNLAKHDILSHPPRWGVPAGPGVVIGDEIPYQPWALAKKEENFKNSRTTDPLTSADPLSRCYLPGVPRITYMPYPFQIFQTASSTVIIYEYVHAVRTIYTDRPHLPGPIEFWMGESRGRWDGDTLVVDAAGFNDQTWLDAAGNFHSDALHVVERYTRTGPDHIAYEVTIEDPKVFTRPWKMSMTLYRRQEKNAQILDYECHALEEEAAGRLK